MQRTPITLLMAALLLLSLAVPTLAADEAAAATPDLLPGVELVTEEVEPGVFRVVSDGVRDLALTAGEWGYGIWGPSTHIAPTSDGSVWILTPESSHRLGDESSVAGGDWRDTAVDASGRLWSLAERVPGVDEGEGSELSVLEGDEWTVKADGVLHFESHPDGSTWIVQDGSDIRGPIRDDEWATLSTPRPDDGDDGFTTFAVSPIKPSDRSYWGWSANRFGNLIIWESWPDGGAGGDGPASGDVEALGFGPDGTSWVLLGFETPEITPQGTVGASSVHMLTRYGSDGAPDRGELPTAVSFELPFEWSDHPELDRLEVAPDGSVWLPREDGLHAFDGRTWRRYLSGLAIEDVAFAPNGAAWVQAADVGSGTPVSEQGEVVGTYVITPEAVAATE